MEDVLDLYAEPYDPAQPTVCFDETSKQLISETRQALTARPGQVERYDYEYERHGTRNVFMFFEPLAGQRHVQVTQQRTQQDFARAMKWLVDEAYPDAEIIRVVLDNLNTHTVAALYETFQATEANRIRKRLALHHTPKHGSWLNMAECEFAVLASQCLDRRIPDMETLCREIAAWQTQRNQRQAKINWQFGTDLARIKLKRLYPSVKESEKTLVQGEASPVKIIETDP